MSLAAYFAYPIFVRALLACILAGAIISMVGVIIVVLNLTTIRFALMHMALLGSAVAMVLSVSPVWGALGFIAMAAWLLGPLSDNLKVDPGLSGALFMTGSLALAFFIFHLFGVPAMEAFGIFSGNLLALTKTDVFSLFSVALVILLLVFWFYREIQMVLYNEELAQTLGIYSKRVRNIMLFICGISIGVVMRLVGAFLIDAIILLPALGALQLGTSLKAVFGLTSIIGLLSTILGLVLSLLLNWPLGVTITLTGVVVLLIVTLGKKLYSEFLNKKVI